MRSAAVLFAALLAGCTLAEPVVDAPREPPRTMAALGDSITRAFNPDNAIFGDHPEASWATGKASLLRNVSHAERLAAAGWLGGEARSFARGGARVADLAGQAAQAVEAGADYVTILVGANDVCARSPSGMTEVDAFRRGFRAAADVLKAGLPDAIVYVVSLPDVAALHELHDGNARARRQWAAFGVCQALLSENATEADREAVQARVLAFNAVLDEEAAAYGFHGDGGAVFREKLVVTDVSDFDFFHPSLSGQARLANVTWAAGPFASRVP